MKPLKCRLHHFMVGVIAVHAKRLVVIFNARRYLLGLITNKCMLLHITIPVTDIVTVTC